MALTQRPRGFQSPASMMSTPVSRNAPTAAANPLSGAPVVASKAAPGVDHAILMGNFDLRLRKIPHRPIEMDKAIRPEAACDGFAPAAVNP